jgi:hypothetical protein
MLKVKTLKRIAFEAVFNYIHVSLLPPCHTTNNRLNKKCKFDNSSQLSIAVDGVQSKIDEYLVSSYRRYRQELWRHYRSKLGNECPDVGNFLACILDDTFRSLDIRVFDFLHPSVSLYGSNYIIQLIETIFQRYFILLNNCL